VVVARAPGRWPLWRQKRSDPLPFGVGQLRGPRCRWHGYEPDERTIPSLSASLGMAPCGDGLMRPPPQRPLEAEGPLFAAAGQRQEQSADLRHRERDQAGIGSPTCLLAGRRGRSAASPPRVSGGSLAVPPAASGLAPKRACGLPGTRPRSFPSAARFASYCGVAPIEASSGDVMRHRLLRAGDRQLNFALSMIARCQARQHPEGRAYFLRKRAAGHSDKEALRCLKRRLADVVYRLLVRDASAAPSTGPREATAPRA
jgi:Transposase IS116/IS110/IS902 family